MSIEAVELLDIERPSERHHPRPPRTRALRLFERWCEQNEHSSDYGPTIRALLVAVAVGDRTGAADAIVVLTPGFAAWREHLDFVAAGGERGVVVVAEGKE
jgi:hypothetical protein